MSHHILSRLLLSATGALAISAPAAPAADFYAAPNSTRTTGTCSTPDTACALGYAVTVPPPIPSFETPPVGIHTVLLAPGLYDFDDIDAGTGTSGGQLPIERGLTLQGLVDDKGDGAVIDVSGLKHESFNGLELEYGGALLDLTIVGDAGHSLIYARGFDRAPAEAALPVLIDGVTAIAGGEARYAASLHGNVLARNSFFASEALTGGAAVGATATSGGGGPKLVGNTIVARQTALGVVGGQMGPGDPEEYEIANSVIRGNPDVGVRSGNGTDPASTITVSVHHSAFSGRTGVETFGPAEVELANNVTIDKPPIDDDGTPLPGSALIDAGTNDPDVGPLDFFGFARVVGSAPDIGAVEFGAAAPPPAAGATSGGPGPGESGSGSSTNGGASAPGASPTTANKPQASTTTKPSLAVRVSAPPSMKRTRLTRRGIVVRAETAAALKSATVELVVSSKSRSGKATARVVARATGERAKGKVKFQLKARRSKLGSGRTKAILRYTFVEDDGRQTVVERPVVLR